MAGKVVLAHWLYFFACLKVIQRSPLSAPDRAYCYAQMVRWFFVPPHFRALGKDVLLAIRQIARNAVVGTGLVARRHAETHSGSTP